MSERPRWRKLLPLAVSLAVSVAVLASVDASAVVERLKGLGPGWLLAAAALGPLQVALGGWRWARVSRALGVPLDTRSAIAEYGLSTGLNQVLPSGVAGDAVRVWRQRGHGLRAATHAAVVDRALGLGSLVLVTALSLPFWGDAPGTWSRVGAVVVVASLGFGLLVSPAGAATRGLLGEDGPMQVFLSGALTASFLLGFGLAGQAVGLAPGDWLLTAVPWLLLAMAVPLSFAGWGIREASAAMVWPWLARTPDEGVAVAAAYGVSVLIGALPGLLFWGWARPEDREAP